MPPTDHLTALRGLRRGETAGLRWSDVDLDAGTAVICRQLKRQNGRLEVSALKTPHSHRVIALDHTTVAALRARRKRQCAEQRAYGDGYHDSGYIFTNLDGTPVSSDRLSNTFRLLVVEHDVPPIRLHDLRHGAATLALAAGVELKVVQEMLGHGSIVVTADTYTSVLPEVAHRAAEKTAAHVLRHAGMVPGTTRRRRTAPASRKIAMPRKTKIRFARRLSARAGLAKMAHQHPRINPPG
jgi:integrase